MAQAIWGLPGDRHAFARAIFDYCSATAKHLPANTAQEDAQFQKALSTSDVLNDLKKLEQLMSTPQFVRYELQRTLSECRASSGAIIKKAYKSPAAEALLWVELEGVFDTATVEQAAIDLGILRLNENRHTVSDLHGIQNWSLVRGAIRSGVLLHLLRAMR